jgi:ABC-2 type transport system permease protein
MSRIFTVASTEFLTLIKSKGFIIGLLMFPILIGLSVAFNVFAAKPDVEDHAFAVVDRTGVLYDAIAKAADAHNAQAGSGPTQKGPHFLPRRVDPATKSEADLKADLSRQVRDKEIFGFVEIPTAVLDTKSAAKEDVVPYYTETPSYNSLPDWLEVTIGKEVTARRVTTVAPIETSLVTQLTRRANVTTLGLVERKADGTMSEAKEANPLQTFIVPFALMYLLFIALMSGAPQLLTAVIEEKMSRISEVLVSSVTPFQLMMGKLIGVAGISTLLAILYLSGAVYAATMTGQIGLLQPSLIAWFIVYLLCATLIFGSAFIAIGAACSDIKDSQGMMQPVMIFLLIPMLMAPIILRQPHSTFATVASLVPLWTPFLMLIRLAMTPPPPMWQLVLSVVLTLGTAVCLVFAAGRIFRVGLLMQGKPPNLPELLRWIRA